MDDITQLKQLADETEFSDKVRDKVKELTVKAKLRKETGSEDKDCLTPEESEELMGLIKADMVLDAVAVKTLEASLKETDKVLNSLKK